MTTSILNPSGGTGSPLGTDRGAYALWSRMHGWRWPGVAMRTIAAVLGGYAMAALTSVVCATLLPLGRAEAVVTGMLISFAVYAGVVVWVFAAASALRAWIGMLIPMAVLGAMAWFSLPGGTP